MRRLWWWLCASLLLLPLAAVATRPASQAELPRAPQRLVVLSPHLVELIYSLGAGDRIIATVAHADYPKAAVDLPRIGDYRGLQLEKIVASNPDLVLYWHTGTPIQDIEQLQRLQVPVQGFAAGSLSDIVSTLRQLGDLLQLPDNASRLASEAEYQLQQLKQQYQQRPTIRVFYELWDQPLSSIGPKAFPAQALALCGAANLLSDAAVPYPQLSAELLYQRQPQLIIQPVSANEPRPLVRWQQDFASLLAVQHQQIRQVDADALHRPTLRTIPALRQLCETIEHSRQYWLQQERQPALSAPAR